MPIRVFHVINQLGYGGGSERQLLLNVLQFDPAKVTSVVCQVFPVGTEYSDRQAASELRAAGIPVRSLQLRGKLGTVKALVRLIDLVRRENAEVIHSSLLLADLLALLAGWLTRTPVVVSLVNATYGPEWVQDNPAVSRWKHRIFIGLYRFLISHACAHAVANSEAVKANAVRYLGLRPEQVSVVHRSIPPGWDGSDDCLVEQDGQAPSDLRSQLGLNGSSPILLNVARVVPNKGQIYLLQAVSQLAPDYPQLKLLIAGEITRQIDLAQIRDRLGLHENVLLLGYRSDVPALHRMSDIGVFASLYEGFSNSLAEACASGLPCVVTDIGGFTEIVDDGRLAVVVPPRSGTALADGIRCLLEDPDRAAKMGRQAREHVLATFSVQRAVDALTEIYYQVAGQSHP